MNTESWLALVSGTVAIFAIWRWMVFAKAAKSAEAALASSRKKRSSLESEATSTQDRLTEVLEGCGAAVLLVDESLHIVLANSLALRWLGHDVTEIVGKSLIQAVLSAELQDGINEVLESGEAQTFEIQELGPEKRTVLTTVYPRDNEGEAWVFVHDVTDVRLLESVRQEFVANVSHELRTPLASIRAMAETLESGALDERDTAKRFLGTMISESDRLGRIADDLLTLSRAESLEPAKELFDLTDMLEDVAARFKARAKRQEITLSTSVPAGLKLVANRDQIEETVVNLVDNALKYTEADGSVSLSAQVQENEIAIRVSDTGIGILEEDIPKIFARFFRVDKARSRRTGGTGLGLSIVKHVAEAHMGSVEVESDYNQGSTFTLLLPIEPMKEQLT